MFRRLKELIETPVLDLARLVNQNGSLGLSISDMRLKALTRTNLPSNSDVFHVYEIKKDI